MSTSTVYEFQGMTCGGCAAKVNAAVSGPSGEVTFRRPRHVSQDYFSAFTANRRLYDVGVVP